MTNYLRYYIQAVNSERDENEADKYEDNVKSNSLYSPTCFNVLSHIAFFPLWTCLLKSPVVSNAVVETHFKQLKTTTLKK